MAQGYAITDLGNLSTNPKHASLAGGINHRGHVHGDSEIPAPQGFGATHAFLWDGQQLIEIDPLKPALSFRGQLNDSDQCVGYSSAGSTQSHAYLWENGVTRDIHVGNLNFSRAFDLNRVGYVTGVYADMLPGNPVSQFRPFLREPNGAWIDLGTFGGDEGHAHAINDHLQVVGFARDPGQRHMGFLWSLSTGMLDLGHLGGTFCNPEDLNNLGQVVGSSRDAAGNLRPFLWQAGVMTDLGTLGGATGTAKGINRASEVVGNCLDPSGIQRAAIWQGGAVVDLNHLIPAGSGWELTGARDINDLGEICGTGFLHGNRRAYKLTPLQSHPRLSGAVPGIAGRLNAVYGMGFTPGVTIGLAWGSSFGSTVLPGCGLSLDIQGARLLTQVLADDEGRLEATYQVPSRWSGQMVLLQAFELTTCLLSDWTQQILD